MSSCCNPKSKPEVILFNDRPTAPDEGSAGASSRLPDAREPKLCCPGPHTPLHALRDSGRFFPVPPSPWKDLRTLLMDIGHRQEEHFRQLFEQQKELQHQLLAMTSGNIDHTGTHDQSHSLQRSQDLAGNLTTRGKRTVIVTASANGDLIRQASALTGDGRHSAVSHGTHSVTTSHAVVSPTAPLHQLIAPDSCKTSGAATRPAPVRDHHSHFTGLQLRAQWFVSIADGTFGSRVNHYLKSKEFDAAIAVAIIANAFVICWEAQYAGLEVGFKLQYPGRETQANAVWPGAEDTFNHLDWIFGILFLSEMLIKLLCWRHRYFYDPSATAHWADRVTPLKGCKRYCCRRWFNLQGWNLLDFCCVVAFGADKMAITSAVNPQNLRLLRLFRIFRVVRFLRWLESLDHLYVMMTAVAGLSRVLMWAIIFLSTLLLLCNLFLVQTLHATYFNDVSATQLSEESLKRHQKMYEYFGTCTRCMLSMFEITLGNWPPVARLLSEEVSQWFTFICVLHKLTIGFAVCGVITGIILQETFKVAQTDDIIMFRQKKRASRVLRRKMQALFDTLDAERDGKIMPEEFTAIGANPDIKMWLASLDIETDDLGTLFQLIDEDNSGFITLDELVERLPRIQGAARGIDMLAMMRAYHVLERRVGRRTKSICQVDRPSKHV